MPILTEHARNIAFDFDGVIAATMDLFIRIAHEEHGLTALSVEDITDYAMETCLDIEFDLLVSMMARLLDADRMEELLPMEGAGDVLKKMLARGHDILVVTAREEGEPVRNWMRARLGIPEERLEVVATGSFEAKLDVLKAHGKSVFVEDRFETCEELAKAGITPILFLQPWNRKPHSFVEVRSWKELAVFLFGDAFP